MAAFLPYIEAVDLDEGAARPLKTVLDPELTGLEGRRGRTVAPGRHVRAADGRHEVKIALFVLVGLGGLVAAMAVVGLALPKGHAVSRTVTFAAPPASVFDAIEDVARYAEWRPDVTKVELLPSEGGRTMFREHGRHGPITYRIEQRAAPTRLLVRIADTSLAFGGTWTHDLKPTPSGGTELTTTEQGEVYNPIFRLLSKAVFSPTATIDSFHSALLARVQDA